MRVPWTARRSNQSILKEISPEYSLEGLMLKLKLILWPHDALEKTLMLGKTEGGRRRGRQRMRWLDCYARCPNHRAGREKASKTMQLTKKGKFIADSSQGSRHASNAVVRVQRALSPSCYPIYKVCISSW